MKVIEIYDKNSNILDHGKNIFKTMDRYMNNFPNNYRECYDKNLDSLELIKVDRIGDGTQLGLYNPEDNTIVFSKNYSLGHELIHMATNDFEKKQFAFESKSEIENGLIEGMTEYHHMKAYNLKLPGAYSFEVFCVTMMEDIPDIFKSFFIPKEKGFFDLAIDKRVLFGLLWSIDNYNQMMVDFLEASCNTNEIIINRTETIRCVRHTIDHLLSIKKACCNNQKELNQYGDKFMDLITSDYVGDVIPYFYPNYIKYAEKQIKKRIRGV